MQLPLLIILITGIAAVLGLLAYGLFKIRPSSVTCTHVLTNGSPA